MATASANQTEKAVTKASAAPARASARQRPQVQVAAPNRREFLFYIWGASMALLLGEAVGGILWFAFPRFKEGEFGGVFTFDPTTLPIEGSAPISVPSGRFHVSNTDQGLLALYGVCTHLGCLPKWVETNNRFECPCHGSKYNADGSYIEGPAPRNLDRFIVTVTYSDGSTAITPDSGGPVPLNPNLTVQKIEINTGSRILGEAHA